MIDRIYIPQLREGSDDCWDDGFGANERGSHVTHQGVDFFVACYGKLIPPPRYCAVYTGTADHDVLDSLARGE